MLHKDLCVYPTSTALNPKSLPPCHSVTMMSDIASDKDEMQCTLSCKVG